jgi:hypothetical protein
MNITLSKTMIRVLIGIGLLILSFVAASTAPCLGRECQSVLGIWQVFVTLGCLMIGGGMIVGCVLEDWNKG